MRGIPGSFFLLESPSLNRKVGESAWCGCGCGWAQVEPLKIVETLHGLSLQTQLTGKVWVGDGDVHSRGISTDAREQGIQVTDLCPSLLSADFLGDFDSNQQRSQLLRDTRNASEYWISGKTLDFAVSSVRRLEAGAAACWGR